MLTVAKPEEKKKNEVTLLVEEKWMNIPPPGVKIQ